MLLIDPINDIVKVHMQHFANADDVDSMMVTPKRSYTVLRVPLKDLDKCKMFT